VLQHCCLHGHAVLAHCPWPEGVRVLCESPAHTDPAPACRVARHRCCRQMSDGQLAELTTVCNRYPDISVTTELPDGADVVAGERRSPQAQLPCCSPRLSPAATSCRGVRSHPTCATPPPRPSHTRTHAHTHTRTRARAHTHTHTHTHAHTHTRTHARTHTHTHTHTCKTLTHQATL
jgi:hypothetical protein